MRAERRLDFPSALLLSTLLVLSTIGGGGALHAQESGRYQHYDVYDSDLLPRIEYQERRKKTLSLLPQKSAMLVRSGDVRNRSNDVDYEFRQRNNLLYLTGVTEQESAILLVPGGVNVDGRQATEILFVAKRNPDQETWTGILMGPVVASLVSGVGTVLPYDRLDETVREILPDIDELYYDDWKIETTTEPLFGTTFDRDEILGEKRKILESLTITPAGKILNGLRMIKSEREIALMQRAIDISIEGHRDVMRQARPGMFEYQFEAIMEYAFHRLGSEEPGYPSIVGSGPNTCILHYETNRRQSQDGELVLLDCGAEYHGYSADITRTLPVNGRFSPEQKQIYQLVLKAQNEAIRKCRAGNRFFDPHGVATKVIRDGLFDLGILRQGDNVATYFMHGTSHFLGLDVHDVSSSMTLKPGMVMTVEPGIYIPAGSDCDKKWWNIGVRIADDILITDADPVNLSGKLERSIEDVERVMGERK